MFSPYDATFITRLTGILKTDHFVEIIYPETMDIRTPFITGGDVSV